MEEKIYMGWLEEDSEHSLERAKKRAGLNKKKALKMMQLAKQRGVTAEDCSWSLDKQFLESRSNDEYVAVAFNGYCFILERITMNCVTMYKLPKRFGQKKTFYQKEERMSFDTFEFAC